MATFPLVSVVLAAYNAAGTISETLESVLAQSYPNVEVVVIDDGSRDDTPDILASFGERIRVKRQPNGGLPRARNAGCALARGEYLALMDADDLCAPDRIAIQVRSLLAFPGAVLCGSDFSAFDSRGPVSDSYGATYYSQIGNSPGGLESLYDKREFLRSPGPEAEGSGDEAIEVLAGTVYESLAFGNFVHPPTVMFRRRAWVAAGPFDEEIRYNSDWECFVRMARLGQFLHIRRPLLAYRISDSQMSSARGNRGRGAVDLVDASAKIWRADPSLASRHPDRIRQCRREFHADAARALVEHDRLGAARMLAASIRYGALGRDSLNTAVKLALPSSAVRLLRRLL